MLTAHRPVIRCIGQIHGCAACRTERLRDTYRGAVHVCDDMCVMQAANRADAEGHARSHAPRYHECGALLDDRRGDRYEHVTICGYGTCVQYLCAGCGDFIAGFGPAGCRCETAPCDHGSYRALVPPPARGRLLAWLRRRG